MAGSRDESERVVKGDVRGDVIDWKKVRKEFAKLKVPRFVFNPMCEPIESVDYVMELSQRSSGKTTQWLLIGLILNKLYGSVIHYFRSTEPMIEPKTVRDQFNVIVSQGYISKITDGKWSAIRYWGRRWYYCNYDEDGHVVDQSEDYVCINMCIAKSDEYKSSYQTVKANLIIFDEFVGKYYPKDEFVYFMDLLSTVIRKNEHALVVMLANSINRNSPYFEEFGIRKAVAKMMPGDYQYIETNLGTRLSVRFIEGGLDQRQSYVNKKYFGFDNPKLSAITGGGWAFRQYPHLCNADVGEVERILDNIYLKHNGELIRMALCHSSNLNYFVHCVRGVEPQDDAIIFTSGVPNDRREVYGLGFSDLHKKVWVLLQRNRFYYSTNEIGDMVDDYVHTIKQR